MYYPYGDRPVEPEIALKYALKLILIKCIFEFLINIAPPASNSVYDREKWFFLYCGAVGKELFPRAYEAGSTPCDADFCYFVPFFFSV